MKIKKLICALLCMLLFLSGCKDKDVSSSAPEAIPEAEAETVKNSIELLYSYSDSFDPYTALTTLNRNLCKLIFDPLIKLDNSFKPQNVLASDIKLEGNVCTVTLTSALFSDGTAVGASDVVYSYNLAKGSNTVYSAQLYEVVSCTAKDAKTVVFTLTRSDPYFVNLLDFPIIKSGSDKITDADGVIQPPVGSGRYVPSHDRKKLTANKLYSGKSGEIAEITLIDAPDKDSVSHYVEVGNTDLYYTDLSDGSIVRMSGKKAEVNLNHLVFIGINENYEPLKAKELRYAISSALDRSQITQSAYYNNAVAATGFFTPAFEEVQPVQTINNKSNIEIALENLERIGYNNKSAEGFTVNSSGKHLTLTLHVNKENHSRVLAAALIAKQLKSAGIEIRVIEVSYEQYLAALQAGNFQLYLGEIKVLGNMDLSNLVIPGGSAAYGLASPEEDKDKDKGKDKDKAEEGAEPAPVTPSISCKDMIEGFYAGEKSVTDIASALITELPQIPVCYRLGLLFYSSDIEKGVEASASDIYFSIERYTFKK